MAKGDFEKLFPPRLVALDPAHDKWAYIEGDRDLDLYPTRLADAHSKLTDGEIAETDVYACRIDAARLLDYPVSSDLAAWHLTRPILVCEFATLAERDSRGRPYRFWGILWIDYEGQSKEPTLSGVLSGKTERLTPEEVARIDFGKMAGKGALVYVSEHTYGTNVAYDVRPDPYAPILLSDILRDECLVKQHAFEFAADFPVPKPKARKRPKKKDEDDDAINMADLNAEQRISVQHQRRCNQISREKYAMERLQERLWHDTVRYQEELDSAAPRYDPERAKPRYHLAVFGRLRDEATLSHYRLRLRQGFGIGKKYLKRPSVAVESSLPFRHGIRDEELRAALNAMLERTAEAARAAEQARSDFAAHPSSETSRAIYEAETRLQAMQHDQNACEWKLYLRETGTDTTNYYEA